jgi:hypothetical protein
MAEVKVNLLAVSGAVVGVLASTLTWLEMSMGPDKNPWSLLLCNPHMSSICLACASLPFIIGVMISFLTNLGAAPAACGLLAFYLGAPYEWSAYCGPNGICLYVLVGSSIDIGPLVAMASVALLLASVLLPISVDRSFCLGISGNRFLTFGSRPRSFKRH